MAVFNHTLPSILLESAKYRFDYTAFCAQFSFDPACLLVQIIDELSGADSYDTIATSLQQAALEQNHYWPKADLQKFVRDMEHVLRREVVMAALCGDMAEQGYPEDEILALAGQLYAQSPVLAPAE